MAETKLTRDHHLWTRDTVKNVSGNVTLDIAGDITLDAGGGDVNILQADVTIPVDKKVIFGNTGEYIVGDNTELEIVSSDGITLDAAADIMLEAGGDDISMVGSAGTGLYFLQANSGDWNISNLTSDKDIIFNVLDGINLTEVMRLDGDVSSLLIASGKKIEFGDAGEYIAGDGTDLSIVSSRDVRMGTPDGALSLTGRAKITLDDEETTTATNKGIFLDLNSTGDLTSGDQILTNIGIDIDIDRAGTTSHGSATVNQTGVYINVLGEGDGVAINEGISIITSGADTNYGVIIKDWADTGDFFHISTTTNGATTIGTVDDDGNDDADLNIDIDGKITLDSNTGEFVMKAAGSIAEFSVANSAYAGMILGYTTVGIDAASDSYVLSATMTVLDDAMKVKFVAPPSGVVEIFAQIYWDTARRLPVLGLSDRDTSGGYRAISFPNATDVTNEHLQAMPPLTLADGMLRPHWVVTGLTAGTAYEWWFSAKTSANIGGVLRWGGTATNQYPPFIMRATALPVPTLGYAVYS